MGNYFGVSTAGSTDLDQLVDAFRQTQQSKVDQITQRTTNLENRRSFFNGLNTRLNALVSQLDKFTAEGASGKFDTRKIDTSDSDTLTATVSSKASVGLNTVKVNNIAYRDNLISNQLQLDQAFGSGTFNFTISSGESTANIEIELDGDETNEEVMKKIASAVNSNDELDITAAYIKDTNSTGRLSFTSNNTGADNKVVITGDDALKTFGIHQSQLSNGDTGRTLVGDTSAGYKYADVVDLNSEIEVNGIKVQRNTNSMDDVLEGVTLNLIRPQDADSQEVILDTQIDVKAVEDLIKPLLTEYNNLLGFLNNNKSMQRSDPSVGSLRANIRGLASNQISSAQSDAPSYLMELGISVSSTGTLSLTDTEKLKNFLEEDPQKVADLFTSEDSFVSKISNTIANLQGDGGLIRSRTLSISDQIDYNKERTLELESRIDQQASALRKQYTSYLESIYEAQAQFNYLNTMPTSTGGAYDSLVASGA